MRFVRVVGHDVRGTPVVAYFHVAKGLGWGGMLGGNDRLADRLRATIASG